MTNALRLETAEFCVRHINRRIPVLLGISSTSTQEVIEYGQHADRLEVDAVLVLNPYYARLTDEYIYHHFKTVANNIKSPVILYNFPALTGQDLSVDLITRLAQDHLILSALRIPLIISAIFVKSSIMSGQCVRTSLFSPAMMNI